MAGRRRCGPCRFRREACAASGRLRCFGTASCCAAIAKRWRAKGMIQSWRCCSGITRNRPTPC